MLPPGQFMEVVRRTPLVAIDLIIRDAHARVLLGLRKNAPARGCWFVPGGRIYKDEPLAGALARISGQELGCRLARRDVQLLGLYDHIYPDSFFEEAGLGTHYIVVACQATLPPDDLEMDQTQHQDHRFMTVDELLAHPAVHALTRNYFLPDPPNRFI